MKTSGVERTPLDVFDALPHRPENIGPLLLHGAIVKICIARTKKLTFSMGVSFHSAFDSFLPCQFLRTFIRLAKGSIKCPVPAAGNAFSFFIHHGERLGMEGDLYGLF